MDDQIKQWLQDLYFKGAMETKKWIAEEFVKSLEYQDDEPNPHDEKIKKIFEYIDVLEQKREELDYVDE